MQSISYDKMITSIAFPNKAPSILMGAGCSASGNIPLAKTMINEIKNDTFYSKFIKNKDCDDYFTIMGDFVPEVRREILKNYISKSKVNVSNIIASQLLLDQNVRFILTTNFDNLLPRSTSLFSNPIPIYDATFSQAQFDVNLYFPSIIYLHGQMHGFWQLNTPQELNKHKITIKSYINEIVKSGPLIIIGYSGDDHILDILSEYDKFGNGLYWVSYLGESLSDRIEELIGNKPGAWHLEGEYNSDYFFYKLAEQYKSIYKYNSFFFQRTLSHITNFNSIVEVDGSKIDIIEQIKTKIAKSLDLNEDTAVNISLAEIDASRNNISYKNLELIFEEFTKIIKNIFAFYTSASVNENEVIDLYDLAVSFIRDYARKLNSPLLFEYTIDLCRYYLTQKITDIRYFNFIIAVTLCEFGKLTKDENKIFEAQKFYDITLNNSFSEKNKFPVLGCIAISHHDIAKILFYKNGDLNEINSHLNTAHKKFIEASQLGKDAKLYNNISSLLIDSSQINQTPFIIYEAKKNALMAEDIQKGSGSYNLACCHSILGEIEESLYWIKNALIHRTHKREQFEQDNNLILVRKDLRFKDCLDKYHTEV